MRRNEGDCRSAVKVTIEGVSIFLLQCVVGVFVIGWAVVADTVDNIRDCRRHMAYEKRRLDYEYQLIEERILELRGGPEWSPRPFDLEEEING